MMTSRQFLYELAMSQSSQRLQPAISIAGSIAAVAMLTYETTAAWIVKMFHFSLQGYTTRLYKHTTSHHW